MIIIKKVIINNFFKELKNNIKRKTSKNALSLQINLRKNTLRKNCDASIYVNF